MSDKKELTSAMLAMYLGCEVRCDDGRSRTLIGLCQHHEDRSRIRVQTRIDHYSNSYWQDLEEVQICLRRLESMTEEECNEYNKISDTLYNMADMQNQLIQSAKGTAYLLAKHFDLFGLLDAGLAIDSTTK